MLGRRSRNRREVFAFCGFISPWFIGFVLFAAVPLLVSLLMSMASFDLYGLKNFHWIGLAHYRLALEDPGTREALRDTAIFTAIFVPLGLVVQIGLALLVNSGTRLRSVFSAFFYLPAVIPTVVSILLIWRIGIAGPNGLFDRVYHFFAPHGSVYWLDSQGRLILILFMVWSTAGLRRGADDDPADPLGRRGRPRRLAVLQRAGEGGGPAPRPYLRRDVHRGGARRGGGTLLDSLPDHARGHPGAVRDGQALGLLWLGLIPALSPPLTACAQAERLRNRRLRSTR